VSRERIRQIEVCAFEKVQKAVKKNIARIEKPAADAAMRTRRIDQATGFSSSNSAMV
jgi:hypothetical protein